jgi:hypothetical protein
MLRRPEDDFRANQFNERQANFDIRALLFAVRENQAEIARLRKLVNEQ